MNGQEAEAVFRSTIREQIEAIGLDPVEETILGTECMARIGVPLDTPLGDLTDEQIKAFGDWLKGIGEEMLHRGRALRRLASTRPDAEL